MTPYLSRTELINFIHFCASTDDFERTLQEQEKKKNVDDLDKKYLKALRTSLTWAKKALVIRRDALDKASLAEVESRLSHLDFRLLPNDEMRRELKKLQQDPHAIHITEDDLADLLLTAVPAAATSATASEPTRVARRRLWSMARSSLKPEPAGRCRRAVLVPVLGRRR